MNYRQILCPSCKKWNNVIDSQQKCVFCEKDFITISEAEIKSIERRKTMGEIKIPIYDTDSILIRFFKNIFNVIQMIFLGIVSFIVWLVAAGPG